MSVKRTLIGLIALTAMSFFVSCTIQKDPIDVLINSMETRSNVQSAVFTLSTVNLEANKYVETRQTVFVRKDFSNPRVPFKFRIEDTNGENITVYDGNRFVSIDNKAKTAFVVSKDQDPRVFSDRVLSIFSKVMEITDKDNALMSIYKQSQTGYKYQGKGDVFGQPCEIIYLNMPAFQKNSEWVTTTYKGIKDGFSWKTDTKLYANGIVIQAGKETLFDVKTNIKIDNSIFSEDIPKGYKVEYYGSKKDEVPEETPELLKVGEMAPDWTLADPNGKIVKLSELRGNVVMLDFWGTWCVWCVIAMPKIQNIHDATKDLPVKIYGLSCREQKNADPAAFMNSKGFNYNILLKGDDVAKLYNVTGFPTFYIIDQEGKVALSYAGYNENMDITLVQLIKHLTAGKKVAS